ncbi:hypothetical protein N566_23550 [Streptomycetaceae bacterium MP113-05]|nr:hypothetical protein N566_23550 [Streptomycetaceae bacterium MP113-05]
MSDRTPSFRRVDVPAPRHAEPAGHAAPAQRAPGDGPHPWKTRGELAVERGLAHVTGRALAPYQSAVVRVGFAVTWLFFLLREWPHRHELYGPAGPWGFDLAQRLVASNDAFTVLLWTDSGAWFEIVYAFAILASASLALGWHARASSVLFMVGVLSLQNRSVFMGDGGDNIVHLMALYLVLTRCSRVWSLDARRAERARERDEPGDLGGIMLWSLAGLALFAVALGPGLSNGWAVILGGLWTVHGAWWAVCRFAPGEPRTVMDILANLVHNGALLVIVAEVCLVYATAGWYKIQGSRWQDGTAVYYPLRLDYFAPWPEVNDVLAASGLVIMAMTYGTVLVQVAFPFTLFHRKVKNVLLALMIGEHLSIAVLMGLPFFSMAMIAADMVFLPTALLVWLGARCTRVRAKAGRKSRSRADVLGDEPAVVLPGAPADAAAPSPDPERVPR